MKPDPASCGNAGAAFAPGRISVVMSVFNGAATLERALQSVIRQNDPDWELIVVDGGSGDGSVDILRRYDAEIARWISEPDRGIYDAWNKAVGLASGEWLIFLGCDDWFWRGDVLARMRPHLAAAYPAHRLVYASVARTLDDGSLLCYAGAPWPVIARRFMSEMTIPHQAAFHHRSLFQGPVPFDTRYRIAGDYDLLLREIRERPPKFIPDLIVAAQAVGGASTEPGNAVGCLVEFYRARARNGLPGVNPPWLWLLVRAAAKGLLARLAGEAAVGALTRLWRRGEAGAAPDPRPPERPSVPQGPS